MVDFNVVVTFEEGEFSNAKKVFFGNFDHHCKYVTTRYPYMATNTLQCEISTLIKPLINLFMKVRVNFMNCVHFET